LPRFRFPYRRRKEKRRPYCDRRFEVFESLPDQKFYEDLYLTEQPYGFVSGVLTALPDNDWSSAAFT
jgi:DNA modification methylase